MSITGDRIRQLRLRENLSLDDVAKYLGVGRQAIYKYEHGTVTNIPLENIEKMATLFGTSPGYLSGWSDEDPGPSVNDDENFILDTYRSLPAPGKQYMLQQTQIARITFGEKPADLSGFASGGVNE